MTIRNVPSVTYCIKPKHFNSILIFLLSITCIEVFHQKFDMKVEFSLTCILQEAFYHRNNL